MKFEVWKNVVSYSSYFKSWLDPVTLGEPKISENAWSLGIGMELSGENNLKS